MNTEGNFYWQYFGRSITGIWKEVAIDAAIFVRIKANFIHA